MYTSVFGGKTNGLQEQNHVTAWVSTKIGGFSKALDSSAAEVVKARVQTKFHDPHHDERDFEGVRVSLELVLAVKGEPSFTDAKEAEKWYSAVSPVVERMDGVSEVERRSDESTGVPGLAISFRRTVAEMHGSDDISFDKAEGRTEEGEANIDALFDDARNVIAWYYSRVGKFDGISDRYRAETDRYYRELREGNLCRQEPV